ncbi:MAG: transcriptional repressor [Muribaculaceae bacterium]|nr:transcriptional repressor [Muribaculaceae bacterium]
MSLDNRMQSHGVRPTAVRNLILSVLDNATHPISALDIETSLDTVDRSSITRALSLFVEKGLIHIIDDGSGSAKYEVCRATHAHTGNETGLHSHEDLHVHFRCTSCGKTYCLPSPIPAITLPSGFIPATATYIITGTCPDCRPR